MEFHFNNWLCYFYFYCICGWIFESTYVSIKTHKLVNRGFMKGPYLPLYGSGAVIVLLAALPFREYPVAVYFMGAIAATILELITGEVMMRLFKVRYWDYSNQHFQFRGHICLSSTIAWGFLSLLMVYVVHQPVAEFIDTWNEEFLSIFLFVITIGMVYDFANAFRNAMDLRAMIIRAEELKKQLNEALEERKEQFEDSVEEMKEQIESAIDEKKAQLEESVDEKKEKLESRIAENRRRREKSIAEIEAAREALRENMEKRAKQLLLHNPGSSFRGMEEESQEVRRRLLLHIQEKRKKK